jgi:hypothetical protein
VAAFAGPDETVMKTANAITEAAAMAARRTLFPDFIMPPQIAPVISATREYPARSTFLSGTDSPET